MGRQLPEVAEDVRKLTVALVIFCFSSPIWMRRVACSVKSRDCVGDSEFRFIKVKSVATS